MPDIQIPSSTASRGPAYLALLFATIAWGGLFHAGKDVLRRLDPFWFTALRYTGAALLLTVLLLATRQWRTAVLRRHWGRLAAYGALGYGMFGILVFVGLSHSQPSHGAVVMATLPLSGLFVRWAFDGQRPAWWAWLGAMVALLGVSFVSGVWHPSHVPGHGDNTLLGDGIAWIGTLGWLVYTRGQAKVPGVTPLEYTGYTAVLALPSLFAIAGLATWAGWAHEPDLRDLVAVAPAYAYITAIATVAAAWTYNHGVRTLGATNGIVFINFVPVSALLIGWADGHAPTPSEWIGTGLVIAALLLLASRSGAAQPKASTKPEARLRHAFEAGRAAQ